MTARGSAETGRVGVLGARPEKTDPPAVRWVADPLAHTTGKRSPNTPPRSHSAAIEHPRPVPQSRVGIELDL